ncbi:MAG: PA14 domain-containing protein [Kiritimatiellaeota bacterium]|nr:PA14 domain-containing protein [Kiritimatiellota bacterium]
MQFINAAMLFGILAVAIPIIIQILNRKQVAKIMWGAMIFLLDSLRKRRKRVLLEEILLLACRCLLPALAALAIARPFIPPGSTVPWAVVMPLLLLSITAFGISFALWRYPKWRFGMLITATAMFVFAAGSIIFERQFNLARIGRGATKDVVLIVDGSSSMSMERDGESNFDRAVKEVEKIIDEAPKGTSFSLVIGGPVPQVLNPVPVSDKRVLRNTISQLRITQGTMQIIPNLTAAAMTLAIGNNGVKQIIIIGDGQVIGWNIGSAERWGTIKNIFASLPFEPQITWRTLSLPATIRNVTLSKIALTRDVVGTDREIGIIVTIENTGTETVTPNEVILRVGSAILPAQREDLKRLEPGQSHSITFRHRFEQSGAALVRATVSADDDLPADDTLTYVVPVMDKLRVLIVNGNPSPDAFRRASTYVKFALRPAADTLEGGASDTARDADFLLATEVMELTDVTRMTDFTAYGVVVLADVPRLPSDASAALARFVSMGGGLLVLPGASANAPAYNNWSYEGAQIMPMSLGGFTQVTDISADDPSRPPARLSTDTFTHDALRNLRTGNDLGQVTPLQYWKLDPGIAGDAHTAGKFSNGLPFIAIKPFGRGAVAMSAFVFDNVASDIVVRRGFVPLMHELVYHLARPVAAHLNTTPSDGATLVLASQAFASSSTEQGNGLIGTYYKRQNRQGESVRRIDPVINFDWGHGSPMPNVIPVDHFSAVWNGTLVPKTSGRYQFVFHVDDSAVLYINNKRVSGPLDLVAGERYGIRVEYEEYTATAFIRMHWKRDGGGEEIVPNDVLLPVASGTGEGSGETVAITDPSGKIVFGEVYGSDAGTVLRVPHSLEPGLYRAEVSELFAKQIASAIGEDGKIVFNVSAGKEESDMRAITPDQTAWLNDYVHIATATQVEDVLKALHGQSFGKEIWRILAIAVFIFLIVEVILTRWISINRRAGEEQNVDFTNDGAAGSASFKQSLSALGKFTPKK